MEALRSIYERIKEIPRWQRWIAIIIIGGILYLLLYSTQITPLKENLQRLEKNRNTLLLSVNRLKAVEKRRNVLKQEIAKLENEIRSLESKLPTGTEKVDEIIKSISSADSQMKIMSIKRSNPTQKKYYVETPYQITMIGTYPHFLRWCEKLSKANRILAFGNISIKAIQRTGEVGTDKNSSTKDTIQVDMKIKAFNLKR
ncbi:type IV pilus assembly protein PilO [Desulfurobacterium pacificum]|uniref:Type IV pilus assembly protein PilO n=1 Tax=Desulfurobacterium pacificum TaxID=240166 RepID=A0ABY1NAB7_9BACT|nr:type 4a pilus biogenesis protein PilO [Desulfurobacterium pacificum]SMP04601.1 type IV pilus assembly protein PilO [Desulfurobacterium pacificum]